MKRLLIVYHSQSGATQQLAASVACGAAEEQGCRCIVKRAYAAGLQDLLDCDGLLLGSPENLGYLSGGMKDFFDRTFYPAQEYQLNLPYGLFVSAGNDGRGAVRQVERIVLGYPLKKVVEPVIVRGLPDQKGLEKCHELGMTLATGLVMGIF